MAINITFNQTLNNPITANPSVIFSHIKPLAILIVGVVIYSMFIFKFYQYLAKKNILMKTWNHKYDWDEGIVQKFFKTMAYILEYVVAVPIIIFFWFIVLATIIVFLSNNTPSQILLVSMAIIAAVRITSYYNEDLSKDLAKMIPFTLLGVFILDMQFFSLDKVVSNINNMFSMINTLIFYLLFVVFIEFIMRIQQLIQDSIRKKRGESIIEATEKAVEEEVLEKAKKEKKKKEKNYEERKLEL